MSTGKIEFKITKEANGDDVKLDSLSIQAARSLVILLDNLNSIAEVESTNQDVRIKITTGSACVSIEAPEVKIAEIENQILYVAHRSKARKSQYIKPLQNIQKLFSANGLTYEANILKRGQKESILQIFDNKLSSVRSPNTTMQYFGIKFLEGKLIVNGGKIPNFHLEFRDETPTIRCTEEEAMRVNPYLYQNIKIATWLKINSDDVKDYSFCDLYTGKLEYLYDDLNQFIFKNMKQKGIAALDEIHDKLRVFYDNKDFVAAKKFIRLFNNSNMDVNRLRTILLISREFKYQEDLESVLENIEKLIEVKIGSKLM